MRKMNLSVVLLLTAVMVTAKRDKDRIASERLIQADEAAAEPKDGDKVIAQAANGSSRNQVLLVSFDGFRWDYLTKFNRKLENFARLKKSGVSIKDGGNIPPFFTYTFPSHYTTATGLYEESHGIVGNKFFDPRFKETFSMYNARKVADSKWWSDGEPIWVSARRQNLSSATFFWPGSEAKIRGFRPTHWRKYNGSVTFDQRVDQSLRWLEDGIDIVCVYFDEPDHTGHSYGPDSEKVADEVDRMDAVLGLFLDGLEKKNLNSKVNFLLTSDHGMTGIWPNQSISLGDYINTEDIHLLTYGPAALIQPKDPSQTLNIYNSLAKKHPRMKVFLKADIPERWHYKRNRRITPIYAVADESWYINGTRWTQFPIDRDTKKPLGGMHGYDNALPSMHPIFFAAGPDIAVDKQVAPFETVNYYLLMCRLLGIRPAPNNGTSATVEGLLTSPAASTTNHDIDACAQNPCKHGTCQVKWHGFTCACDSGWEGKTCEQSTKRCSGCSKYEKNPCGNGWRHGCSKNYCWSQCIAGCQWCWTVDSQNEYQKCKTDEDCTRQKAYDSECYGGCTIG